MLITGYNKTKTTKLSYHQRKIYGRWLGHSYSNDGVHARHGRINNHGKSCPNLITTSREWFPSFHGTCHCRLRLSFFSSRSSLMKERVNNILDCVITQSVQCSLINGDHNNNNNHPPFPSTCSGILGHWNSGSQLVTIFTSFGSLTTQFSRFMLLM